MGSKYRDMYALYYPRFGERIQNSYSLQAEQAGAGPKLQGREINYTWAPTGRGQSWTQHHTHTPHNTRAIIITKLQVDYVYPNFNTEGREMKERRGDEG